MTTDRATVAVVTVTYNSADDLSAFLESVDADSALVARTVVADNPSPQSDRAIAIATESGAHVVRLAENVGYGAAVNFAVADLDDSASYVLVANPDVRIKPGAIASLVHSLESSPHAGSVGPRILNEDGTVYPSARRIPSLRTGIGHALLSGIWPGNPWTRSYRQENLERDERREVGWLSGACLLVRRSAFDAIGGFDKRYFMYFEDVDLGYRLGKAGWANVFEPTAVVVHTGGRSTATQRPQMLIAHHRSADQFLATKYPGLVLAPLRWSLHVALDVRARWLTRGMRDQASSDDR